ncbi:hypothetical protein KTE10_24165 [Burkholderia multivorans]|nr:hypothetical protein [Burkholderia multivorans]MBU9456944.1 hypothetical protein [Burkholderia multivorans]
MDQIDAMKVFVATLDERSGAGAGWRLAVRGPRAAALSRCSRPIPAPRCATGARAPSGDDEAGERHAAACRRLLADFEEADMPTCRWPTNALRR